MSPSQAKTTIALARFWPGALFNLEQTVRQDSHFTLCQLAENPGEIWQRVLTLSADILLLTANELTAELDHCIDTVLRTTQASVLVAAPPELAGHFTESKRLHFFPLPPQMTAAEANRRNRNLLFEVGVLNSRRKRNTPAENPATATSPPPAIQLPVRVLQNTVIAIGSSTGGTEALLSVFRGLPVELPAIVVVQHMPPVFTEMYAQRLDQELPFAVREAGDQIPITPGSIHIAPGDRHMEITKKSGRFYTRLVKAEKMNGHCPSVDRLFYSVAQAAKAQAVGVILTGMGADGAAGMLAMRRAGAFNIGQDEPSCVVYGMPRKAFEFGALHRQAALADIPQAILGYLQQLR